MRRMFRPGARDPGSEKGEANWPRREAGRGRRTCDLVSERVWPNFSGEQMTIKYPGIPTVIHGNGAVAEVMGHVCGGVIGYPITPSTEISEIYEAFRASGGCNVWGKHPFFFEPEGEHSAQSGALGAALTGGKYVSNASSSQGILYGMESHYVTVGKKVGGFVLHVAARVVSKHSLNVMAGPRRRLRAAAVRLHDPVRQQPAGSRRPRRDRLQGSARCR